MYVYRPYNIYIFFVNSFSFAMLIDQYRQGCNLIELFNDKNLDILSIPNQSN